MSKEEKKQQKAQKKLQKAEEKQQKREARSVYREQKGNKDREIKWGKLDNTAHLFPVIAGDECLPSGNYFKRRNSAGFAATGTGYGATEVFRI